MVKRQEDVDTVRFPHDIQIIQGYVAAWSKKRFGTNRSKTVTRLTFGSLAPLFGIVAKLGELEVAETQSQIVLAIGDVLLYLCDFASREDMEISHIGVLREHRSKNVAFIAVGEICHSTLKFHRKEKTEDEHRNDVCNSIAKIIAYLNCYVTTKVPGVDLISILKHAVNRTIKHSRKRKRKQKRVRKHK